MQAIRIWWARLRRWWRGEPAPQLDIHRQALLALELWQQEKFRADIHAALMEAGYQREQGKASS